MRWVVVLAALLLVMPAAAARAHGGPLDGALGVLGQAVRLPDGLYEVPLRTGPPLITHGADGPPAPSAEGLGTIARRPPLCTAGHHQHVLYGRHVTAADRLSSVKPVIEALIFNMNAELDRAAMESGGRHADYRVKCDLSGQIAVGTFVSVGTTSFADVVDAARLSGAIDPNADYTIFYDDPTPDACGIGSYSSDSRPGAENANNSGGGYAVIYSDCWDARTVMHESGHNQGAVQPGAPHATGALGHCRDEADVMCYADGAEGQQGMLSRCAGGERFDCGYDDYFDVAPEPGEYLESHWNLGSPANRFIVLSDPAPGEAPAAGCVAETERSGPALAVDTTGCPPEPPPVVAPETEEPLDPPVRIVRVAYHRKAGRVQVRLACPGDRASECRGRVLLARRPSRGVGGRSFRLEPADETSVRIPLRADARRAWASGRLPRVWVVARAADATADASRVLKMGPPARSRR